MLWLSTFTAGFMAVPSIALVKFVEAVFALLSMMDFKPVN